MKISVVLVTHNSEANLDSVLNSAKDFDELVVVDINSTDHSCEIAQKYDATIYPYTPTEDIDSIAEGRYYGCQKAKNEWVLLLRDYELIPRALTEYLKNYPEQNPDVCGLFIPKKKYVMHRYIKSAYPDYGLRFINKKVSEISPYDGAQPDVKGLVKSIPAAREDLALVMLSQPLEVAWRKQNNYSKYEALRKDNRNVSLLSLWFKPLFTFLRSYILSGLIAYGREGYILSMRKAIYTFMVLSKIHESKRIHQFNQQYADTGIQVPEIDEPQ